MPIHTQQGWSGEYSRLVADICYNNVWDFQVYSQTLLSATCLGNKGQECKTSCPRRGLEVPDILLPDIGDQLIFFAFGDAHFLTCDQHHVLPKHVTAFAHALPQLPPSPASCEGGCTAGGYVFEGFGCFDGFFPPPMTADNGPRETGMAAHVWRL